MRDRTVIASIILVGTFLLQGICIYGVIQGLNGLLMGIFSGLGNISGVVVGYYFGREGNEEGGRHEPQD